MAFKKVNNDLSYGLSSVTGYRVYEGERNKSLQIHNAEKLTYSQRPNANLTTKMFMLIPREVRQGYPTRSPMSVSLLRVTLPHLQAVGGVGETNRKNNAMQ